MGHTYLKISAFSSLQCFDNYLIDCRLADFNLQDLFNLKLEQIVFSLLNYSILELQLAFTKCLERDPLFFIIS